MRLLLALGLLLLATPAAAQTVGMGLGMFASDPDWDYGGLVDEIAELGARDVLVVVPWYQRDVRAVTIQPRPGHSPTLPTVQRTLEQIRAAGLRASVMPIVLLETTDHPKQWRGVVAPELRGGPAVDRWFAAYAQFVLAHAVLAERAGAARLVVGSELLSMEGERALWLDLIARVRAVFGGRLLYSANWDHFQSVTFWDALDEIGVNGYFRLAPDGERPSIDALVAAWEQPLRDLAALRDGVGLPLLLTEIGYPSNATAAAKPWCRCPAEPVDLGLQADLLDAFTQVLDSHPALPFEAVFLWNWFGHGGPTDTGFTPRGKPAETVLRRWFQR